MTQLFLTDFDLHKIMNSGQVFRIRQLPEGDFLAVAGNHAAVFRQEICCQEEMLCQEKKLCGKEICLTCSCTEDEFQAFWHSYFDLDTDYGKIKASVDPSDFFLTAAIQYGGGIRVLRQELWETIISFLISQNNNISRIRNSIEALCERFGRLIPASDFMQDGQAVSAGRIYTFPTPEALCAGGIEGLQGLGLGYRDKYILAMARRCCGESGKKWLEDLQSCDYDTAVRILLEEFGIGRKVADCVCLFALHHVDAFPVDTHVKQILAAFYPGGFPFERYQGYAGILQQYMFAYKLALGSHSG